MNPLDFSGKRVLITQATDFMGPVLLDVFRELGATVFADGGSLEAHDRPAALVAEAGQIDILIANLGVPAPATPAAAPARKAPAVRARWAWPRSSLC